ncbi:hypothetical protein NHX12_008062 [Muraenolepis orangiensis]|uniref:EGF-like domain-containing protein n=1 Tax=Muraenolepis orangiensis TaxID=630683 RepID=A0A9Q0DKL9_9TELE|nr:hypothetical protein NHX12_008062 [Muraenolepis orangiensis]
MKMKTRTGPTSPSSLPLLLLLVFQEAAGAAVAVPSAFQLAPDTPAPAEPTPTRAGPRLDPCEGRPCLNGGFCLALRTEARPEEGSWEYRCTCTPDFTGRNCEAGICEEAFQRG